MHIELDMAQFSFISLFRSRSDIMEMKKLKLYIKPITVHM